MMNTRKSNTYRKVFFTKRYVQKAQKQLTFREKMNKTAYFGGNLAYIVGQGHSKNKWVDYHSACLKSRLRLILFLFSVSIMYGFQSFMYQCCVFSSIKIA